MEDLIMAIDIDKIIKENIEQDKKNGNFVTKTEYDIDLFRLEKRIREELIIEIVGPISESLDKIVEDVDKIAEEIKEIKDINEDLNNLQAKFDTLSLKKN